MSTSYNCGYVATGALEALAADPNNWVGGAEEVVMAPRACHSLLQEAIEWAKGERAKDLGARRGAGSQVGRALSSVVSQGSGVRGRPPLLTPHMLGLVASYQCREHAQGGRRALLPRQGIRTTGGTVRVLTAGTALQYLLPTGKGTTPANWFQATREVLVVWYWFADPRWFGPS